MDLEAFLMPAGLIVGALFLVMLLPLIRRMLGK